MCEGLSARGPRDGGSADCSDITSASDRGAGLGSWIASNASFRLVDLAPAADVGGFGARIGVLVEPDEEVRRLHPEEVRRSGRAARRRSGWCPSRTSGPARRSGPRWRPSRPWLMPSASRRRRIRCPTCASISFAVRVTCNTHPTRSRRERRRDRSAVAFARPDRAAAPRSALTSLSIAVLGNFH